MTKSFPWNSLGHADAREAARLAARRAGLTLSQWLDATLSARATTLGLDADDLTDDEKIDAIAQALETAAREAAEQKARRTEATHLRPRATRFDLLDAAARRVEREGDLSDDVARRISEIESLLIERALPRATKSQTQPVDRIDGQLARIAQKLRAEPAVAPRRTVTAPAATPQTDVMRLRRQVGDLARSVETMASKGIEPALRELIEKIDQSRAEGVSEDSLAPIIHLLADMRRSVENTPSILARAMRDDVEALSLRIDALAENGVDPASFTLLRQQVESMAHSLAEMAGRMSKQDGLEQQLRVLTQRVEDMAAVPRELAGKLIELAEDMRRSIERLDTSPALRALERRIDQAIRHNSDMPPIVDHVLQDVRRAVQTLSEHPALSAIQKRVAELAAASGQLPQQIVETLTQLRHAIERMEENHSLAALEEKLQEMSQRALPVPAHLTESLSEIRFSIERLAANAGLRGSSDHMMRLESIEQRVSLIAERLETPPFLDKFESLHQDMLLRLDRASGTLSSDQVSAIMERIEEMQRAMAQPSSNRLEDLVAQLAAKIERMTGAGAADPRALQAIENQLLRIAERLDRNGGSADAIDTIERSIGDVVSQIARARAPEPAPPNESEQRTQSTLTAVHETLEKVVDRLAMLEGDVGNLRRREAPVVAPEPAAAPVAMEEPVAEPVPAPMPAPLVASKPMSRAAPDVLIEPGTGFKPPMAAHSPDNNTQPASDEPVPARQDLAVDVNAPRAAQASFIAAARRATQLTGAPPPPVRHDDQEAIARARAVAAEQEDNRARSSDMVRRTVYGCSALALILAGWQFANAPKRVQAFNRAAIEEARVMPASDVVVTTSTRTRSTDELLLEMAQNGQPAAQAELALRYLEGRNLPRDPEQAMSWFRKAAEQNFVPAQYRLGTLYEKGIGASEDQRAAALWYGRAAQGGHVRAMHNLGVLLANGLDDKPDYAGAARLFRKAAEHGLRDSQYNLAVLHVRGLGVEANLVEAYKWFTLAGKQGDMDAANKREEIAKRLNPPQINEARTAADGFALLTPDPTVNEPMPAEAIVKTPDTTQSRANPAQGNMLNRSGDRVTMLP